MRPESIRLQTPQYNPNKGSTVNNMIINAFSAYDSGLNKQKDTLSNSTPTLYFSTNASIGFRRKKKERKLFRRKTPPQDSNTCCNPPQPLLGMWWRSTWFKVKVFYIPIDRVSNLKKKRDLRVRQGEMRKSGCLSVGTVGDFGNSSTWRVRNKNAATQEDPSGERTIIQAFVGTVSHL